MFKYKTNSVSQSAVSGTVVGTCRIHPQKTYAIVDHDPSVLNVDAVTGELFLITPDTVTTAVSAYGVGVQALVDGSVVSSRAYSVTNGFFANSVPVIDGVPLIVGVAKVGETLTVIPAPVTGVPTPEVSLQLQLDAVDYGVRMVGTTFVPTVDDEGGVFTVIQYATNSEGSDDATSAATSAVAAGDTAPGIAGVPTISGAAQEGQTLTATPAPMTGSPPPTATYQWYDDGDAAISGATDLTYMPVTGDVGDQLYIKQTATNGIGSPATADSALTGVIAAVTPFNASPVITSNGAGATAAINLSENITQVTTVTADYAYPVVYSITGGADAAKFSINPTTGELAFLSAPDYDTPTDANTDNDYIVEVTAAAGPESDVQTITVTVADVSALAGTTVAMPWTSIYYATMSTIGTATPSGEQAYDFVESTANNYHYASTSLGTLSAGNYILGIEAKADEREHIAISVGGGPYGLTVNLSTGAITGGTQSGASTVTSKGSGWYWLEMPFTSTGAALNAYMNLSNASGQGPSYQGVSGYGMTIGRTWRDAA